MVSDWGPEASRSASFFIQCANRGLVFLCFVFWFCPGFRKGSLFYFLGLLWASRPKAWGVGGLGGWDPFLQSLRASGEWREPRNSSSCVHRTWGQLGRGFSFCSPWPIEMARVCRLLWEWVPPFWLGFTGHFGVHQNKTHPHARHSWLALVHAS